jgi:hypothetical protein
MVIIHIPVHIDIPYTEYAEWLKQNGLYGMTGRIIEDELVLDCVMLPEDCELAFRLKFGVYEC